MNASQPVKDIQALLTQAVHGLEKTTEIQVPRYHTAPVFPLGVLPPTAEILGPPAHKIFEEIYTGSERVTDLAFQIEYDTVRTRIIGPGAKRLN